MASIVVMALIAGGIWATNLTGSIFASDNTANTIEACANGQHLRIVDDSTTDCKKNETGVSWNEQGLKGDKGDQGIQGDKGDKGDKGSQGPAGGLSAVTTRSASFNFGAGATSSTGGGTSGGVNCDSGETPLGGGYSLSPNNAAQTFELNAIGPLPISGTATGWQVDFYNAAGSPAFTLTVYVRCAS